MMTWELEAAKRRVPAKIDGLIPRSQVPNNRYWFRKAIHFERNGEKILFGHLTSKRFAVFVFFTCAIYQMWRVPIWGYIDLLEHHNYSYDNIVYDKLSTRNAPYHSGVGFP